MKVLIADDHALMRHGLIGLMRDAFPGWQFAEAASLDEALERLAQHPADFMLIDLKMPGMDAGTSLAALRDVYPDMRVAVLTATEEREVILECLSAGVHGYILKSDAAEQLLLAIGMILDGQVYVPAALTRVVRSAGGAIAAPNAASRPTSIATMMLDAPRVQGLTARQLDVLKLLAEGRSTKDIARRLNLGIGTVKVHLAGVYRALGARNRMEAVVRAGRFKPEE